MRARNLKPSIFNNEQLARLGSDHFRLFEALWCMADRKGRLEDRPEQIESKSFPFKFQKINIEKMLVDLADCGERFITRYERDGKRYILVNNFLKHNYPHMREKNSTIPAPVKHSAGTSTAHLNPESLILNPPSLNPDKVAKRIGFVKPTPQEATAYARTIGFKLDGEAFCAHYDARGWKYGPGRPMVDWRAAVVTWKKKAEPSALIQPPRPMKPQEPPPKPEDLVTHDQVKGLLASLKSKEICK